MFKYKRKFSQTFVLKLVSEITDIVILRKKLLKFVQGATLDVCLTDKSNMATTLLA